MRILYSILCLCFLIFFHELGHFLAAKFFGVEVEAFSIGFGPILLRKKIKTTEYRLSLIPLGGYCAMKGEKDFSKSLEMNLDHIEASKDSLYGVHAFKRILIAFAGPFFNLFFAFIGFFVISIVGYSYFSYSNQINLSTDKFPEMHSPAKEAGILSGDRIISINGKKILNFNDIMTEVAPNPDKILQIKVLRNSDEFNFDVHTDFDRESGSGKLGVMAIPDTVEKYEAPRYSFFPAIWNSMKECGKTIALSIKGIFTLFKGVNISKSVSGPARIVDMVGDVIQESFADSFRSGIVNLFSFTGIISISLFIMNLLPVPVLDGGLILFAFLELVTKRKFSPKILYYIQFIGIAFILFMFVVGLNGDIHYFIENYAGKK